MTDEHIAAMRQMDTTQATTLSAFWARSLVELNPLPSEPICPGMWVHQAGAMTGFYLADVLPGDVWLTWHWAPSRKRWTPVLVYPANVPPWEQCDPPGNATDLYALLGMV